LKLQQAFRAEQVKVSVARVRGNIDSLWDALLVKEQ
jgi:hypothetical protein